MFESICIRRQRNVGNPIDLGFLAESLVFCQTVHVVADPGTLQFLFRVCGPDALWELCTNKNLALIYVPNVLGVRTENQPYERHDLILVEGRKHAPQEFIPKLLQEVTGRSGKGRRVANKFSRLIRTERFARAVLEGSLTDIADGEYVRAAVSKLLDFFAPEYEQAQPLRFNIHREEGKLVVETNIDFVKANEVYHKRIPATHSCLSVASLLGHVLDVRGDLQFSSATSSDIALSDHSSIIARCKFNDLLHDRRETGEKLELFQDFIFEEGRSIREAVNGGNRTFAEVVKLVGSAQEFKEWLKGQPDSSDIRREYCREVSRVSWADKLPTKTARWLLFTGAGLAVGSLTGPIGTILGIATGAVDTFLVDRLMKGWKPNQFVAGPLTEFVRR